MAAKFYGTLDPNGGQTLIGGDSGLHQTILNNSAVITLGDAVKTDANGNIVLAGAGGPFLGFVTDILKNGASIRDAASLDTYTAESDNETVDKVYCMVDVSRKSLWSLPQDGTAGTTVNSNERGAYIDFVAASDELDEDTATRTRATSGQCTTFGADQDDSTRLVVAINESELISAI